MFVMLVCSSISLNVLSFEIASDKFKMCWMHHCKAKRNDKKVLPNVSNVFRKLFISQIIRYTIFQRGTASLC